MAKYFFTLFALLAIAPVAGMAGTLIAVEEAAEVSQLELRLNGSSSAVIYARACDRCELLALSVDNSTRITRGQARLSLEQAATLRDKGASVMFNPSTLQVTRIIFWN